MLLVAKLLHNYYNVSLSDTLWGNTIFSAAKYRNYISVLCDGELPFIQKKVAFNGTKRLLDWEQALIIRAPTLMQNYRFISTTRESLVLQDFQLVNA